MDGWTDVNMYFNICNDFCYDDDDEEEEGEEEDDDDDDDSLNYY